MKPDQKISYYYVTLQHDEGKVTIRTTATSHSAAGEIACKAEMAPDSAIVKIRKGRDLA